MAAAAAALDDFETRLPGIPWFASCGESLGDAEFRDAAAYLRFFGLTANVTAVAGWAEAGAILQRSDWVPAWWTAEEDERRRLTTVAAIDAGPLKARLGAIARRTSDAVHGAAAVALTRHGIADPGLARSAAGAVSQAVHQAALVVISDSADDHGFRAKFRLFEAGRWPLGVYGESLPVL